MFVQKRGFILEFSKAVLKSGHWSYPLVEKTKTNSASPIRMLISFIFIPQAGLPG